MVCRQIDCFLGADPHIPLGVQIANVAEASDGAIEDTNQVIASQNERIFDRRIWHVVCESNDRRHRSGNDGEGYEVGIEVLGLGGVIVGYKHCFIACNDSAEIVLVLVRVYDCRCVIEFDRPKELLKHARDEQIAKGSAITVHSRSNRRKLHQDVPNCYCRQHANEGDGLYKQDSKNMSESERHEGAKFENSA